jgi:hypothetical protein
MRADPRWMEARLLPKKEQAAQYQALKEEYQLGVYDAILAAPELRTGIVLRHLSAKDVQALAKRAFLAVEGYLHQTRGKPRYKRTRDGLASMTGGEQGDTLNLTTDQCHLRWGKELVIPLR